MSGLLRCLRGQRIDGRSTDELMTEMHDQAKEALIEMVHHAPTEEHRQTLLKKLKEMFK